MSASSGTVTFLFTDIEGSTRLWQANEAAMRAAVARHDELLREVITGFGGRVFSTMGDGIAAVFPSAEDAILAAKEAQERLGEGSWPTVEPIRVRMGLHSGEAEERDGDYFGTAVNRAARLMAIGHGGQILCSSTTAGLVEGEATLLRLGEHRLRDLDRAIEVFQVGESPWPRLRSLDAYPGNLPAQLTEFVGRQVQIGAVTEALKISRVVTLTGVGGVGKTRLAIQGGAEMLPRYPGGVWLVELAGLVDPDAVQESVNATLRVTPQSGMSLLATLTVALSGRPTLVVLDNCEHVIEGAARFVDAAIRAAPELVVLTTSREALGVTGERVVSVGPLSIPGEDFPPEAVLETEAVQLFCDRARAVRSTFLLGPENCAAVARICRRLDGIPLALELAAARVRSMAPAEIASRLDSRFQLLTGGSRGAASRHQTLRRAIDWSFELLGPEEAGLLEALSVCAGGFDLPSAEFIGNSDSHEPWLVVELLDRLVDKSLVVADDLGAETRYRMLETVRDYAFEKLEAAGRASEARARHGAYYTILAEVIGEGMRGSNEMQFLERAEREFDNLRTAVLWSCDADGGSAAQRILASLGLHGTRIDPSVSSWATAVVTAVQAAMQEGAPPDPRWPATRSLAAWRLLFDGDLEAARDLGQEALETTSTATDLDKWARCMAFETTTAVDIYLGQTDIAACEEWAQLAHEIGDLYLASHGATMLCVHRMFAGVDGALKAGQEGVATARASGSPSAMAYAIMSLGQALGSSDPHRSVLLFDEAIRMADSVANEWAAGVCAAARGAVLSRWGDRPAAARALLESARRTHVGGNRPSVAEAILGIAGVLIQFGRLEGAAEILGWVERVRGSWHTPLWMPEDLSAAIHDLPHRLGADEFGALVATGDGLTDEEVVALAALEVEALPAPNTRVE